MSHSYHHRYSQYPEADRENLFPLEPSLDPMVLLQVFRHAEPDLNLAWSKPAL